MEMNTLVWIVLLLLILVLLVRVTSLQRQLNELKRDVERLENGSTAIASPRSDFNYTLSPKEAPPSHTSPPGHTDLDQELIALVQKGNKIVAIKRLREARGLSLKEAKDYVDSLHR